MKISFENKIYAGFASSMLILAIVFFIFFLSVGRYQEILNWVERTYHSIELVDEISINIKSIENAQRTYITTGWTHKLEEFSSYSEQIHKRIELLESFKEETPLNKKNIDSLSQLINDRINFAQTTINAYHKEGFEKARALMLTGRGEALTARIMSVLKKIDDETKLLLNERTEAEKRALQLVLIVVAFSGFVSMLILAGAFFIVKNEFKSRKKIEDAFLLNNKIMSNMTDAVYLIRASDGIIVYTSPQFENLFGYNQGELIGKHVSIVNAPSEKNPEDIAKEIINALNVTGTWRGEVINAKKDGTPFWCDAIVTTSSFDEYGSVPVWISTHRDITDRKITEEKLREQEFLLSESQRIGSIGSWSVDLKTNTITWSPETFYLYGVSSKSFVPSQESLLSLLSPHDRSAMQNWIAACIQGKNPEPLEITIKPNEKQERILCGQGELIYGDNNTPLRIVGTVQDITARKRAEETIKNSEKRFRELIEALPQLFWTCRVDGPCDYLSKQWVEYTGIPESEQLGYRWLKQLHPDDRNRTVSEWMEKVLTGESFDIEFRIRRNDGEFHWFKTKAVPMRDNSGNIVKWFGSNTDFDDIKKAEVKMQILVEELERSNKELEQFAYVASHDLQEPLRMVSSYTQLLANRYKDKLDGDANDFINFAVDGASRMQRLINDLLEFSRIQTRGNNFHEADTSLILAEALINLRQKIEESNAIITNENLPVIICDQYQIVRLFQNLIDNAIKFRGNAAPLIHITSETVDSGWKFSINDNGIGIDPKHKEKIFEIFQRLHATQKYPGTGIGLAICKRIVERHGGTIWVESQLGKGTSIYFTILKKGNFYGTQHII